MPPPNYILNISILNIPHHISGQSGASLLNCEHYALSCPTCSCALYAPYPTCYRASHVSCLTCLVPYVFSCLMCLTHCCTSRVLCHACSRPAHTSNSTCSCALWLSLLLQVFQAQDALIHLMSCSFHTLCLLCF